MAIEHKFKDFTFENEFYTKGTILNVKYEPEILILGSFNPSTNEIDNMADFYYGRNWLWTVLFNIFEYKAINLKTQRKFTTSPYQPTLKEILKFCAKHKIVFADFITQVLHKTINKYQTTKNKVNVQNKLYDLIKDTDLGKLDKIGEVEWITDDLIEHLKVTKSISTVYFTRQPKSPFTKHWNKLVTTDYNREIKFKKLFTPSGQSLEGKPRVNALIKRWLNDGDKNFDKIDENWLIKNNIDITIFDN